MPQKTSCSRCCCQQCCRVFWSYGMRVPMVPAQFLCVFLSFYCIRNLVCFIATEFISGATIRISDSEPWSVVIVTKVMECLHSFLTCKEMIYVDTTSRCKATSSSIIILFSSVKVGTLLLAVLVHPVQTMERYQSAFKLQKRSFPKCFGGEEIILNYN